MQNLGKRTAEVTLDCGSSRNLVFSEPSTRVTRLVEPGATEFFLHAEPAPEAEDIARGVKISYKEVY